ncbi:hypothetical protein QBC46DRAFT_453760 [Diplogelasinospora grovesii]|uniref:Phthiocerol/phthiodiolone dimycocerosyl transferase C-terminal domain-containing protein n=1 Tax=Diplogelasinospora grovesii TaxID=303347 RepID=A0AAN6S0A2_9PEZI|nr:hypothetical protein QBC46DRAFT_453760 [Diplogelasinospora grovesii]
MERTKGFRFLRPLGGVKDMFAAYSAVGCITFSIIARIRGELTKDHLQAGLKALQHCHKKLTLAISHSLNGRRFFVDSDKSAPLRVLESESTGWEEAVMQELVTPFVEESGQLFRITALLDGVDNILILTFHHTVADSISAAEEPWGETIKDWLSEDFIAAVTAAEYAELPSSAVTHNKWAAKVKEASLVRLYVFSPKATARIVIKARREQTTVHAVLLAAIAQARYDLAPNTYPAEGLRLMTPIDVRPFARPLDRPSSRVRVYITAAITSSLPPTASNLSTRFWDEARALHLTVASSRDTSSATSLAVATELQMRRDASPGAVTEFMKITTDHEGRLSNLGKLEIDIVYGNFEIISV